MWMLGFEFITCYCVSCFSLKNTVSLLSTYFRHFPLIQISSILLLFQLELKYLYVVSIRDSNKSLPYALKHLKLLLKPL